MTADERRAIDLEVSMAIWDPHSEDWITRAVIRSGVVAAHASAIRFEVQRILDRLRRRKLAKFDRRTLLWSGVTG